MRHKKRNSMSDLRVSKKGNMPFAIIAVILLISGSTYAVIASQTEESSENAKDITKELDNIDTVIERTEYFVEKGLGEIIFSLSTASSEGTIEQRTEKYHERANDWMDFQFPIVDSGVTVSLESFYTDLTAESLELFEQEFTGGYSPSYLVGKGSFTAKYNCDSGSTITTTDFETDASCALPLIAEQGSLFKNAIDGPGSVISQMMNYQLTCLAQYRVMNGYGAVDEYGDMGTYNILTNADISLAYSNTLKILGLLYFHISPDGNYPDYKSMDLADYYLSSYDDKVRIDLSLIYSQALISIADDVALQWIDYLYGNKLIDGLDNTKDILDGAWDSLKGFFSGKNEFSAAPYIEAALSKNGFDVDEYRYLLSDRSFVVSINGEGLSKIIGREITDMDMELKYPNVDLMSWDGIKNFKQHYRENNNDIREWLTGIINSAAIEVGHKNCFGTLEINIDPKDETAFIDSVSGTIKTALEQGNDGFITIMNSMMNDKHVNDPFYSSIFKVIEKDLYQIYHVSDFKDIIRESIEIKLKDQIKIEYGTILNDGDLSRFLDDMMSSTSMQSIVSSYSKKVNSLIEGFDSMNHVDENDDNLFEEICKEIIGKGLGFMDRMVNVQNRILSLCDEVSENIKVNSYFGITELPGMDNFVMIDKNGNISSEKMSMIMNNHPEIDVHGPEYNTDECIHYVGFLQDSGASYSTVFTVSVKDRFDYVVSSKNSLDESMGIDNSEVRDSSSIELSLKISVISSWALKGVEYSSSNTILSDAWTSLVDLISPLLEPLKKILSIIMDALDALNSALIKIGKFIADLVQRIYNAIMEPLEQLKSLIENKVQDWFSEKSEKTIQALEWIVGANASKQTVGFSYMGFTLTITLNLASLIKNTKTLFKIEMGTTVSDLDVTGSITVKQKGEGTSKELIVTGAASITGDDWEVNADIDPTMKTTKYMICLSGNVEGTEFDIVLPDVVSYNEVDFSLQDIPGIGAVLSNIPIGASKVSIDLGINLKYNAPFKNGLVVNEFESNPEGSDSNNEWIELYNASSETIDISGYSLRAGANKAKVQSLSITEIKPGARAIVELKGSFLNNSSSSNLKGGDYVLLLDEAGNTVDKTPTKKDTANDDCTWQRVADASTEWIFEKGTPDGKNCGGMLTGTMVRTQLYNIMKDSATSTLSDMGTLLDGEDLTEFFQKAMQNSITSSIEMLSECLVEASIYISIDVTDMASAGCVGFEASLSIDSDFMEDGLKCLVGEVEDLLFNIGNPYGLDPKEVIYDNTYLGIKVYTGMKAPKFLGDSEKYPNVMLCVDIKANISSLDRLLGGNTGSWKVIAGVKIIDCPCVLIPSSLNADKDLHNDLWLLKATFKQHR